MGEYKGPEFYDKYLETHFEPYPEGKRLYQIAAELVCSRSGPVVDLGCGPGWFAQELERFKFNGRYTGIDFSEESIAEATRWRDSIHEFGTLFKYQFFWTDITTLILDKSNGLYVCMDVLEHLQDDLAFIRQIPSGSDVLLTLPTYDSDAHVRWFTLTDDLCARYGVAGRQVLHEREWFVTGVKL